MPHFYFHVHDSSGELRDEEGRQLPNLAAVREAALKGAKSLICADVLLGKLDLDGVVEATDGEGKHVLAVSYRAAIGLAEA